MEFLSNNWGWLAGIFAIVSGFGTAIYRVATNGTVKKNEIYEKNGQPIYRHRSDCKSIVGDFQEGIGEIKQSVDQLDKSIQHERMVQRSFMSAVKEKLDLKFTVPKD